MEYGPTLHVDNHQEPPLNPDMHNTSYTLGFIGNIGWPEILIVGVVLLLLFGRRLPEMGRSLGQGIVEFKRGLKDVTDDIKNEVDAATEAPKSEPPKFDSAKAHTQGADASGGHANPSEMSPQTDTPKPNP
jgi:sec-independent protein translocase protein TatA